MEESLIKESLCPTSLSGVYLKAKAGVWPSVSSKLVDLLYSRARDAAQYEFAIRDLKEKLNPRKEEIINIVKNNPDILGICAKKDNFDLLVIRRRLIEWNRELLKQSLRVAYPGVVSDKELLVKILIPEGFEAEMLQETVREGLIKLGISEKNLARLMESEIIIDVDEKRLNELLRRPRGFRLKPGAKKEKINWAVKIDKFKK